MEKKKHIKQKIRTTLKRCAARKKVVHRFPDTCAVRRAQVFILVHGGQLQDSVRTTPAHHFSAHNSLNARAQLRTTVRTRPAHKAAHNSVHNSAEPCAHKACAQGRTLRAQVFFFRTIQYIYMTACVVRKCSAL